MYLRDRNSTNRAIWGLAKKLAIDKEEVYTLLYRETKKESMRDCTDEELKRLLKVMELFNDTSEMQINRANKGQIDKIFALAYSLKWDDNKEVDIGVRINKFCKRMVKVENLKWLTPKQAYIVIEGLKKLK
jgi:hypothetical protein